MIFWLFAVDSVFGLVPLQPIANTKGLILSMESRFSCCVILRKQISHNPIQCATYIVRFLTRTVCGKECLNFASGVPPHQGSKQWDYSSGVQGGHSWLAEVPGKKSGMEPIALTFCAGRENIWEGALDGFCNCAQRRGIKFRPHLR